MTLNDRELVFITYSTDKDWAAELPKANWLCVLVDNDRARNYLSQAISRIIDNDVCYVCTVGQRCELNHDLIDEEIVFRQADIEAHYLPDHDITTTWHRDLPEGIWFAVFVARREDVSIDKVVILDMTEGKEREEIKRLLAEYGANG